MFTLSCNGFRVLIVQSTLFCKPCAVLKKQLFSDLTLSKVLEGFNLSSNFGSMQLQDLLVGTFFKGTQCRGKNKDIYIS